MSSKNCPRCGHKTTDDPLLCPRCGNSLQGAVADALAEAHALGYVHRDLRPRNVMLVKKRGKTDFVKLLDFGLSKLVMPQETRPGVTAVLSIGDPRYMAPELLRGEAADRRSDIWSLGVIGYEMLTGSGPFEGATPPAGRAPGGKTR